MSVIKHILFVCIISLTTLSLVKDARATSSLPLDINAGDAGNEYYIALDGSDSNPGSEELPWQTISHGMGQLLPGDTLYVKEGTYVGPFSNFRRSGEPGKTIRLQAYPGHHVILTATRDYDPVITTGWSSLETVEFWEIDGFDIDGGAPRHYSAGIFLFKARHFILSNLEIHNMTGSGWHAGVVLRYDENGGSVGVSSATHNILENNRIHDIGGEGIYIGRNAHAVLGGVGDPSNYNKIIGNTIHDCTSEGVEVKDGAYYNEIRGNVIFNCGSGSWEGGIHLWGHNNIAEKNILYANSHGVYISGKNNIARNNLIYNNQEYGLRIDNGGDKYDNYMDGGDDNAILNNTIVGNGQRGVMIRDSTTGKVLNTVIKNNIISDHSLYNLDIETAATSGNDFDYNDWSPVSNLIEGRLYTDILGYTVGTGLGAHSISADPLFMDLSSSNFHLTLSSPLIDTGADVGIADDLEGHPRPQGKGFDIGAYEYDPGTLPPTFQDVPFDHWAYAYIEALYQAGYIAGCSTDPLLYCPEEILTRAESAVFIERGIHDSEYTPSDPAQLTFDDVPLTEWFAKWTTALWDDGYTSGCGTDPLIYCPLQEHTRAEGSVFFLRMMHGMDYVPPDPTGLFADVPLEAWYADWAEAAYKAGIIPACETEPELRFCPDDPLDRAMAAYMMVQAKNLPMH